MRFNMRIFIAFNVSVLLVSFVYWWTSINGFGEIEGLELSRPYGYLFITIIFSYIGGLTICVPIIFFLKKYNILSFLPIVLSSSIFTGLCIGFLGDNEVLGFVNSILPLVEW